MTSAVKGEAKTTTAINLAYTLAENGEKVCLIEGDMRLPTFRKKMNLESHAGLSEFLTGQKAINDVVIIETKIWGIRLTNAPIDSCFTVF